MACPSTYFSTGRNAIEHHPDRAKLALLAAAGHQQTSNPEVARQFARLARDWGCTKKLLSQVFISGVHNTLARAATARHQEERARRHFEASVSVVTPHADAVLLGETRAIRELARLGLLPQAAQMLNGKLADLKKAGPAALPARLDTFAIEIELLQCELSLALQRRQLFHTDPATPAPAAGRNNPDYLAGLQRRSTSQLGQDLWVLERTGHLHGGYFVEFGATDGVLLSNTYLLETEFAWQGICAEPNPKLFAQLQANRRCLVSAACIADQTGTQVEFILADAYGGIARYAQDDNHRDKRAAYRDSEQVTTLTTISLDDFLRQHGAPRDITYLSIDTEGSEFAILEAFPFDQWSIRLITVEHNFTERRADIRCLLERHGYSCTEREWDDWYELKN